MSKPKLRRLGDLQLRIMKLLWAGRPATVAEVHERLNEENAGLAYTTVATMLRKMEARGLVKHETEGRTFIYTAAVGAEAVTRGMADDFVDRLFEGSLSELMHHLLTHREVSREELSKLERLIAERKKRG